MFGKINKDAVKENNSAVEEELKTTAPPPPQEEENTKSRDIAGNILAVAGNSCMLIGAIGAAMLALAVLTSATGLSPLIAVILLVGVGIALMFCGNKLMVNNWIDQLGVTA